MLLILQMEPIFPDHVDRSAIPHDQDRLKACGEIEKAKQMMRAIHSSKGPFKSGSRVWT